MMDIYQQRYLAYQGRKRRILAGTATDLFWTIETRVSQRTFNDETIAPEILTRIYESIRLAPSSCNRQAILVKPVTSKADKRCLEDFLVGGRDWLSEAQVILLLFADMIAYKSPAEVGFMPYLDAGVVVENVYLVATALDIGVCYVNPNILVDGRAVFDGQFNPRGLRFCGAMALGRYDRRATGIPKRQIEEIFY